MSIAWPSLPLRRLAPFAAILVLGACVPNQEEPDGEEPIADGDEDSTADEAPVVVATAAPEPAGFALFAGAPSFGDEEPLTRNFKGVSFSVPKDWENGETYVPDRLLGRIQNLRGTARGRFLYHETDDAKRWASPDGIEESQTERTAKVTQNGKAIGAIEVPSWCEGVVYRGTVVHPSKQRFEAEAQPARFGVDELPGSVLEGKDAAGKWKLYCVRIAISDRLGVLGGLGHRVDGENAEALAASIASVMKSFRHAPKK